jgi:AraC family transcriptional regulator
MHELNSGKFFGSEIKNHFIGGVWTSLAQYDEALRRSAKNFSNAWHVHQNPHFSLILEGGNIERRRNTEAEGLPGQIRFYHAGEPHQNVNVLYPSKNFNVEIDAHFLSRYDLSESMIDSADVPFSSIKFTMLQIYKETFGQPETSELAIHSLILGMFSRKGFDAKKTPPLPRWADRVIQILHDRWNENLTLKELSEIAGVHPITVSRHFPKYFFCTLGEYVRRVRIEKSLRLIKQSNDSLTDIAHNCGFSDQSHFTRVFKELTGLRPGSFRRI